MAPQAEESGRRRKLEQADCKQDCGQNSTVLTGGGEIASSRVSSSTSKRSNLRCWMAEGTTTQEPSCDYESAARNTYSGDFFEGNGNESVGDV